MPGQEKPKIEIPEDEIREDASQAVSTHIFWEIKDVCDFIERVDAAAGGHRKTDGQVP